MVSWIGVISHFWWSVPHVSPAVHHVSDARHQRITVSLTHDLPVYTGTIIVGLWLGHLALHTTNLGADLKVGAIDMLAAGNSS